MNITSELPRPEYPRPQMVRSAWINLNGRWEFEFDYGVSGRERNLHQAEGFSQSIVVPFCPESKLSGIDYKDFMNAVWYRRTFTLPADWDGQRVLIHFGAVDYKAEVWINGISVGTHIGGYSSFTFEITDCLSPGENVITVCAEDDGRSRRQPRGKQSSLYHSHGCDYTRTTGIWQTVWLERVPPTYITSMKFYSDAGNSSVHVHMKLDGEISEGARVRVTAAFDGKSVGMAEANLETRNVQVAVPLSEVHLWGPGSPYLYDLKVELIGRDSPADMVEGYFGLRDVMIQGKEVRLNGKSVFQRLVLDQGFYPDGIYTAPTDEALRRDIELSMELGFNGARLHEKIFEPRFLYWADKLGYLVWGEHANWGMDISTAAGLEYFLPEWLEAIERDFNHPAIIGWCPFNETWDNLSVNHARQNDEVLRIVYQVTKALDRTRPVIDTSGNFHVITDIFDVHDYDQDTETFAKRYESVREGRDVFVHFPERQRYEGQPYFVSEYGGIWWNPEQVGEEGWGYGNRPKTEQEFLDRYAGLTSTLLSNPSIFGFCYTQLYDVEQEVNGLYTYERRPKFDATVIRAINTQVAAIEK